MIGRWTVVNVVLVVVVLLLGVQITRTWMRALPATRAEGSIGRDPDGALRDAARRARRPRTGDPETIVAAIAAKDLFDPTRSGTADAPVGTEPVAEPPPPPGVVVVGVRLMGDDAEAVIEDTVGGKEQRRVRAGDSVGVYTVEAIHETSVVLLATTGESVTLWIDLGGGAPAGPTPATAQRPATQPVPNAEAGRAERAATRRAAQRAARRGAARQGAADLPEGVRERLEALRRNR